MKSGETHWPTSCRDRAGRQMAVGAAKQLAGGQHHKACCWPSPLGGTCRVALHSLSIWWTEEPGQGGVDGQPGVSSSLLDRKRQGAPALLQPVEGEKLKSGAGLGQGLESSGCPGD